MRAIVNIPVALILAIGKQYVIPKLQVIFLLLGNILLVITIYWWGTLGAAVSMTIINFLALLIYFMLTQQYLSLSLMDYIGSIFAPLASGMLMVIVVSGLSTIVQVSLSGLIILIGVGAITYIVAIIVFTKGKIYFDFVDIVSNLR